MTGPIIIDYRFAEAVNRELERDYAPGLHLQTGHIAAGFGVSRTTVFYWKSGRQGIKRETVAPFLLYDDFRGRIARRVFEIHADHERWQLEKNMKAFRKWQRDLGKYGTWQDCAYIPLGSSSGL